MTRVTEPWYTVCIKATAERLVIMATKSQGKSISHCQGKGSIAHNNRLFMAKNIDATRTKDNIIFIQQPIAKAYEEIFDSSVERYNEKQKRNDRKITTSYFENVFNHKPVDTVLTSTDKRKSFYEDLVQIGTMDDTNCGSKDAQTSIECLSEYIQGFTKRNPNMHVFNAVLHVDEQTPHLHIDYIPIGHYTRGIDTQNGLAQGLKEMGYTGKNAISEWREKEREVLTEICCSHGLKISAPKKSRGYSYTVDEYKKHQEKIKKIEKQQEEKKEELKEIKENLIEQKRVMEKLQMERRKIESELSEKQVEIKSLINQSKNEEFYINSLKRQQEALQGAILNQQEVNNLSGKKSLTGALKGISYDDYLALKQTAKKVDNVLERNSQMQVEIEQYIDKIETLNKEKSNLKLEIDDLRWDVRYYKNQYSAIQKDREIQTETDF